MAEFDLNDKDFDELLRNTLDELPPDSIADEVTPWRESMVRILTGYALNAITLNFLGLNYLLPAIGVLLSLLGYRTLRGENRWFRRCWILMVIRATLHFPTLILNATIWQSVFYASPYALVLTLSNLTITFLQYYCLWKALREVQMKAGETPDAAGVIALIVWHAIVCGMGLLQFSGVLVGIILIILYIGILRTLYELSKDLENLGYSITASPVRFTDKSVAGAICLAVILGCISGYLFFSKYPINWQPVQENLSQEVAQIKMELTALGFPEEILEDLTDEDILECAGATQVIVDVHEHPVNEGRQVSEIEDNHVMIHTVYDQKELQITGIAVALPGAQERWKIIHHFEWVIDPEFYGTECIQLWPAYRTRDGWDPDGDVSGQLLYNEGEQVYTAPYYSLDSESYSQNSVIWGYQNSTDIFAAFSLPNSGSRHRGYVSYTVKERLDGYIIAAYINYNHQTGWLQYPVENAMDNRISGRWIDNRPFRLIQDGLLFYPNDEDPQPYG